MSLTSLPGILQQQGAAAGGYDPSSYGSPLNLMWVEDPSESPSPDDAISAWNDMGSNAKDWSALAGKEPLWKSSVAAFNGQPAMLFDGSNDWLSQAEGTLTTSHTIVVVGAQTSGNGTEYMLDGTGIRRISLGTVADSPDTWRQYGGVTVDDPTTPSDSDTHLFVAYFSDGDSELLIDGISVHTSTVNVDDSSQVVIGGGTSGTANWDGHIALVVRHDGDQRAAGWMAGFVSATKTHYGIT